MFLSVKLVEKLIQVIYQKYKKTYWSLALILAFYIIHLFYFGNWKQNIVGAGDANGYYLYLPSILIHKDYKDLHKTMEVKQSYLNNTLGDPLLDQRIENGNFLNQYTCGVAILNSVPFGIAHLMAPLFHQKRDGYAPIYRISIHFNSLLFVFAGLFFLARFLAEYFKDEVIAIALLGIALGTNLFYLETLNGGMAHGYLFGLHALLLWVCVWYSKKTKLFKACLIGLLCGMITLIRPDEIIVLFIPIFIIPDFWKIVSKHYTHLILAAICFLLPSIPQLLYWKIVADQWIYYSYGEQSFNFANPHIWKGIFSFKNGWLLYSPIMVLSIIGLLIGLKNYRRISLLFISLLIVHIYVIYSWWCWNYINGFGSRPMIEYYAILGFPFALCVHNGLKSKIFKSLVIAFIGICMMINLMHTHQLFEGVLFSEDSTKAYYLSTFGKFKLEEKYLVARDINQLAPKQRKLHFVQTIEKLEFNTDKDTFELIPYQGKDFFRTGHGIDYSPSIKVFWDGETVAKGSYIKVYATVFADEYANGFYEMGKLVMHVKKAKGALKTWQGIKIQDKINDDAFNVFGGKINMVKEISYYYRTDFKIKKGDEIFALIWNPYNSNIYVHDITLELWSK